MTLNDPMDLISLKLLGFGFSMSVDTVERDPGKFLPKKAVCRIELSFGAGQIRCERALVKR